MYRGSNIARGDAAIDIPESKLGSSSSADQGGLLSAGGWDDSTSRSADFHLGSEPMTSKDGDFAESKSSAGLFAPSVSTLVWEAGKTQAEKAFNLYANIDILRPYFSVEPQEVKQRIIDSFIPKRPAYYKTVLLPNELYGPLMLVLTLIALLLYGMKAANHVVKEGTLMGTAFGVSFGYWLGVSAFVYFLAYLCNTHLTFFQVLSMMGYALSGHCLVLLFGTTFHAEQSHLFFYLSWLIFGGLTAGRMISVILATTSGKTQKLLMAVTVGSLHLLDLLYLHFAYHKTVEALDFAG